jgi:hypothetical protein
VFHVASAMAAASHASTGVKPAASCHDECSTLCNDYAVMWALAVVGLALCVVEQTLSVQRAEEELKLAPVSLDRGACERRL